MSGTPRGMMRHSRLPTTTEVNLQSLEDGVRSKVYSILREVSNSGTWAPAHRQSAAVSACRGKVSKESAAGITQGENTAQRADTQGSKTPEETKPVRGVILEFATRMRQSRGGRELLND
jgi:hypothetical protein